MAGSLCFLLNRSLFPFTHLSSFQHHFSPRALAFVVLLSHTPSHKPTHPYAHYILQPQSLGKSRFVPVLCPSISTNEMLGPTPAPHSHNYPTVLPTTSLPSPKPCPYPCHPPRIKRAANSYPSRENRRRYRYGLQKHSCHIRPTYLDVVGV
jgi:hypothetical protein